MASPRRNGATILIVDDDERFRGTLEDILTLEGYDIVPADSAQAALARVDSSGVDPQVAILDLGLPDLGGLDVAELLRARAPHIQTIILTGNASVDSAAAAVRSQTFDYLVKPVDPKQLLSVVSKGVDRWRSQEIEAGLTRDRERFRRLVESLSEIVTVVEADGRIAYESPALQDVLGFPTDARLGQPFADFIADTDRRDVVDFLHRVFEGDTNNATGQFRVHHASGTPRTLDMSAALMRRGSEEPTAIITSRDVTDRVRLEAELRQAHKMEAVGQLTGGVAHELNNVLAIVVANGQAVARALTDGSADVRRDATDMVQAAQQGATLIRKLLAFSRRARLRVEPIAVTALVTDAVETIRGDLPANVRLVTAISSESCVARVDRRAIEQVLLSLVNNAREAMADGGDLTVEVDQCELTEAFTARHKGLEPGTYVGLRVRDTGAGMDASVRDQIFQPFFTTKPAPATGLGLAMVFGIVKQQDGYVRVESAEGQGTTVEVFLPVSADAADAPAAEPAPAPAPAARPGSILVVDDQPALLRAARRILERQGFAVATAADGEEALELLSRGPPPALIIADVVMPRMSGKELHAELDSRGIHAPMLFTSGYSATDLRDGELLDPRFPMLPKPWTYEELVAAVESALDASGAAEPLPTPIGS